MDAYAAIDLLKAATKKLGTIIKQDPIDLLFDKQVEFVKDSHRLKCAFCTRRAGKSLSCAAYLIRKCLYRPNTQVLYIALTRKSAKNIMWPVLRKMVKKKAIPSKELVSELSIEFANESKIFLTGANANVEEMEKLLGMPWSLIVIDEGASFRIDLRKLVYDVLKPATADTLGEIVMIGTPSDIMSGLFYDVATHKEKGWKVFTWSALDNPYMKENWQKELDEIIETNPEIVHTAGFKRHYLGQWAVDEDNLVYKWSTMINGHDGFDDLPKDFIYVLGVDLGSEDDTAFCLDAFSPKDDVVYELMCYKQKGLDFTDTANIIKQFEAEYNIFALIVDGANKQGVDEMRRRHGLALKNADKHDKNTFIELMNADLRKGKIKTVVEDCEPLILERSMLLRKWDDFKKKWIEDPKFPNHGCDAALYAWRYCYAYLAEKDKKIDQSSPEYEDYLIEQEEEQIQKEKEWWEQ